eukprot:1147329-Pelagomonas_calceolata.AAC.6
MVQANGTGAKVWFCEPQRTFRSDADAVILSQNIHARRLGQRNDQPHISITVSSLNTVLAFDTANGKRNALHSIVRWAVGQKQSLVCTAAQVVPVIDSQMHPGKQKKK